MVCIKYGIVCPHIWRELVLNILIRVHGQWNVFATFQVHAYMSSLPEEKVPYIDSIGERHRNKQIIVQLPPYDSEARFCNGLTDEEKRELRIFVALRKRDALDRGVVKQIPDVSEGYGCREVRLICIPE